MQQNEYDYRIRGWAQLYTAGAFLIFTGLLLFLALSQQDSFFGAQLTLGKVNLAYWASTILSALLGGYVLYIGVKQRKADRKIIFKTESLSLPKTIMSNKMIQIDYKSIHSVKMDKPARSTIQIITIKHDKTRTEIAETGFSNNAIFTTIYEQLREKVKP